MDECRLVHSAAWFLEGLRILCDANGALLIFDEVKTGAKLAWGGASDYFGVKPDMICLAKSMAAACLWVHRRQQQNED